jgi:A/G-specific adenine glycosylase
VAGSAHQIALPGTDPAPSAGAPVPTDVLVATALDWYADRGRDLPWRRTRDPYAILVSEFMLQQTQVARVVPRYEAWLARWPTARSLADAPVADVIAAWSGLGYNRRAVNLHAAARVLADDGVPDDLEALRRLPGVGPYTAAAVACFALGQDVIPVDVNVRRVLSRAAGVDVVEPAAGQAYDLTQALFDLGATVCLARVPRCGVCPLAAAGCPSRGRTYAPTRAQGRFEGSSRQRRGALLRAAAAGPVPLDDDNRAIALALERDGLLAVVGDTATLPGRAAPCR